MTDAWSKIEVALINLVKDLKVNDQIVFIKDNLGVKQLKVEEIEKNKRKILKAKKGEEVGIKIPFRVSKNTEVYLLKER